MQNKISRRQFLQVTGASAAALLLAGLPVEASAASGHLTVTPDTLVSDLRADPTFAASGVWTWQSAVDSPDTPEAHKRIVRASPVGIVFLSRRRNRLVPTCSHSWPVN